MTSLTNRRWQYRITLSILTLSLCAAVLLPGTMYAQTTAQTTEQGLVRCSGVSDKTGRPICDFKELVELGIRFVNYLTMIGVIFLAAGLGIIILPPLVEAGFTPLSQNPAKRTEVKNKVVGMFKYFALLLVPWLLVNLIAQIFLGTGLGQIFKLFKP